MKLSRRSFINTTLKTGVAGMLFGSTALNNFPGRSPQIAFASEDKALQYDVAEGYFNSPYPGEDSGPARHMLSRKEGLDLRPGERLISTARAKPRGSLVVLREPGEVFLYGQGGGSTGWVERLHPESMETLNRSTELSNGGYSWPGSIMAHQNGYLYVVNGAYCHKLSPELDVVQSRALPQSAPYNGGHILPDGNLITKDLRFRPGAPSQVIAVDPITLQPAARIDMPEGTVGRISVAGEYVYVVGINTIFRLRYKDGEFALDNEWSFNYRRFPDDQQSYGWAACISGGHAWFMDNGAAGRGGGVEQCQGCTRGSASGPIHLIRVNIVDSSDAELFTPFELPWGRIVSPPVYEPKSKLVVCYDSSNARLGAFRFHSPGEFESVWQHSFGASMHFLIYPDTGELIVNDFTGGTDKVVVLDLESGEELARADTTSPVQSVLWLTPGWERDLYYTNGQLVARLHLS